jgi:hypothetical protein
LVLLGLEKEENKSAKLLEVSLEESSVVEGGNAAES